MNLYATFLRFILCPLIGLALLLQTASPVRGQVIRIDSMLRELPRVTNDTIKIALLHELAYAYYEVEPESTLRYARQALTLSLRRNNLTHISRSYNLIGIYYDVTGDYTQALHYYFQSLQYAEKAQSPAMMSNVYNNIGLIHQSTSNYPLSLKYFENSLETARKAGKTSERYLAYTYNNLGRSYQELAQYEPARKAYLEASRLNELYHDSVGIAENHIRISSLYSKLNNFTLSLSAAQKANRIARQLGNNRMIADALDNMGIAYGKMKNFEAANKSFQQAFAIAQAIQARDIKLSVLLHHSQAAEQQGDYLHALTYFRNYESLKDSLFSVKKSEQITRMQTQYETNRKEQENQLLRAANEKKQAVIRQQQYSVITVAAVVLLLVGVSVVLYLSNQQKRKHNQLLRQQQLEISEKNTQLVKLNKEITQQSEAIQAQNGQLGQLNQIKNQLISIISHDVRAPLNSIQGMLALLKAHALNPEEVQFFTSQLESEVQHTSLLLNNLLDWTRSQMEGFRANPVPVSLQAITAENCQLLHAAAAKKGVFLQNQVDASSVAYADPDMVKAVIRNLAGNAIKFCQPGRQVVLSAYQQIGQIQFSVRDTGVGIKTEDIVRLFNGGNFTTLGTQREKGTGMGLQLCKDLVEKNGGSIWVESEPGKGSTFSFTLPLVPKARHLSVATSADEKAA